MGTSNIDMNKALAVFGCVVVALESVGIPPQGALFIDDRPDLVEKATRIGMKGICFETVELLKVELINRGLFS